MDTESSAPQVPDDSSYLQFDQRKIEPKGSSRKFGDRSAAADCSPPRSRRGESSRVHRTMRGLSLEDFQSERRKNKRRHREYFDDDGDDDDYDERRRDSRTRSGRSKRLRERKRDLGNDKNTESAHGMGQYKRSGGDGMALSTTGIVSDDEDYYSYGFPAVVGSKTATTTATAPKTTKNSPGAMAKKQTSPSSHDDLVGHFQGRPGTVIADRYRLLREVGLGTFGRVVDCLDLERCHRQANGQNTESYVAIKIVRSVKRYCDSAKIEANIVRQINQRGGRGLTHCVVLHDSFHYRGHFCMVFESLGPSLYDFMKRHDYRPFPMICIQDFAVQLMETMEFLHSFGLVHTDLKIENILLISDQEIIYRRQRVPESTRIKLIDFGGASYDYAKKSSVINTRQYRAPEVILEAGWSMPSDMWSLGCILAELYRGELLFSTHENIEHLALIETILGPFPRSLLRSANKLADTAFDSNGRHRMGRVLSRESLMFVKDSPSLRSLIRNPDDGWFLRLLSDLLCIDPEQRSTAHECLRYLSRIKRDIVRCA